MNIFRIINFLIRTLNWLNAGLLYFMSNKRNRLLLSDCIRQKISTKYLIILIEKKQMYTKSNYSKIIQLDVLKYNNLIY